MMEPRIYCERKIQQLREREKQTGGTIARHQKIAVLAYFAQQTPPEREFARELALLAESAERSQRTALALAARSILSDWQERSGTA
jgi:hypothetical protein